MPFEDPEQLEVAASEDDGALTESLTSTSQQSSGHSRASSIEAGSQSLSRPAVDGLQKATEAANNDSSALFDTQHRDDRPSVGKVMPAEARMTNPDTLSEVAFSPEQDPTNIEAGATSEADVVPTVDETTRPMGTQEISSAASRHDSPPRSKVWSSPLPGVPPKHLHGHLDVETKEVGRDVASRP